MGIIFILLIISLSYGHSLAFSTTFLFISIVMVSSIYTHYNITKVHIISIKQVADCYAGNGPLILNIILKNHSHREKFDISLKYKDILGEKIYIAGDAEVATKIFINFPVRGKYRIEQMSIFSEFPFSLFRAFRVFNLDTTVWVYPKIFDDIELREKFSTVEIAQNEVIEKSKISQNSYDEFKEHKNFEKNDSWKHIDWKLYAKTGDIYLKTFESNSNFIIDFDDDMLKAFDSGEYEAKISVIASLLYQAKKKSLFYSFNIKEFHLPNGSNKRNVHLTDDILRALAMVAKND